MRKLMLNMAKREKLMDFCRIKLTESDPFAPLIEKKDLEFKEEIASLFSQQYPLEDMQILKEYGVLRSDCYVYVFLIDSKENHQVLTTVKFDNDLQFPKSSRAGVKIYKSYRAYKLYERINELNFEREKWNLETKNAYKALIYNSKYFDDVVEVWPEAEELREEMQSAGQSLMVLSDEIKHKIADDIKRRQVLQEKTE